MIGKGLMFKPISLSIQGFKSFTIEQSFDFPEKEGFYFLTGKNVNEPELEANGSGKTSMWDAMVWCLYGKTSRNLKASDVGTWGGKHKCRVELSFEYEGTPYFIKRTWKPNSLKLAAMESDFEDIEQSNVDDLIGLDFEAFQYAVLFSQFRDMFFDLKPAEKATLFTTILNLSEWDAYSHKAKMRLNDLEGWYHDSKEYLAELKGKITVLEDLDYVTQIDAWEEKRVSRLEGFTAAILDAKKSLKELETKGKELLQDTEDSTPKLQESKDIAGDIDEILSEIDVEWREIMSEKGKIDAKITYLERNLAKFDGLKGICNECGQEIDENHVKKHQKQLNIEKKALKKQHSVFSEDLNDLEHDKSRAKTALAEETSYYRQLQTDASNLKHRMDLVKRDSKGLLILVRDARLDYSELEAEENPYVLEQAKTKETVEMLKKQVKEQKEEVLSSESKIEKVKYWVKGFKEVRLFLISEVLGQLELEVNNCLYQLGLRDWKIEFAVDKETKSGTIRKGFTVLIYSPYNEDPVAWESWSGGESQRLRLAGTLGLSNLILARNGVESYFEVFDEPSTWLSAKGIVDLLETLDNRARELHKQIWIIDHRSLEYGGFEGAYCVTKDSSGSKFETLEVD